MAKGTRMKEATRSMDSAALRRLKAAVDVESDLRLLIVVELVNGAGEVVGEPIRQWVRLAEREPRIRWGRRNV